ncbi:substrate-binding periplasmic protein [Parasedimentitalea denitrificans]|nr:transporter substrate-binding domain-containing protein [Sedimentitalea sp. CY04]
MRLKLSLTTLLAALVLPLDAALAEPVRFVTIDYKPYALHDDPKGRHGLLVDINTAIAERAELAITDSVLPITRVVKNLAHNVSDCGVFLLTTVTEQEYIPVAKILDRFETIIVTRPGLGISKIEDLRDQRLALPRGSFEGSSVLDDPKIELFYTNNTEQGVHLLQAGRVDAVAGTSLSLLFQFSVENMGQNEIGEIFTYERQEMWLQCAKNQLPDETIAKLRKATDSLRMEGAFDTLIKRYIPDIFS